MSQSNKGVIAVVAGGCLLGLAIGLAYVFYWAPKQKAKETRQEIEAWGERWDATKDCLLGDSPGSGHVLEAVVARELSVIDLKPKLGRCISALKALPRDEGANTEEQAVEDAWYALRLPVGKLAQAHAWRTAKEPDKDIQRLWTNLATAIDAVDAHYAALRKAADLGAPTKNTKRLPVATRVQALETPEGKAGTIRDVALHPGRITYRVDSASASYLASLGDDGPAVFAPLSPLALRAADEDWGLWIEHDGIPINEVDAAPGDRVMVGALDGFGEPGADGTLLHTVAEGEQIWLKFAMGAENRIVLFRRATVGPDATVWDHQLLSSADSGATWTPLPLPAGEIYVSLKRAGRGNYISWADSPTSMRWHWQQLTREGSEVQILDFAGSRMEVRNWPPELCQSANRAWWLVDGTVYTIGPDNVLTPVSGRLAQDTRNYAQTMSCSDQGFAITSRSYQEQYRDQLAVQTCDVDACKTRPLRIPAPQGAAFFAQYHQGQYTVVVAAGGAAALWSAGKSEPTVFSLDGSPASADPEVTGAVSRQGSLQLLLWPDEADTPQLLKLR